MYLFNNNNNGVTYGGPIHYVRNGVVTHRGHEHDRTALSVTAKELYLVLTYDLSMAGILIDRGRSETETLVKAAFESMDDIKQYAVEGRHIVGETGMRLTSNGERVAVEVRETDKGSTECVVSSEKAISNNITANPQKYERRLRARIEEFRDVSDDDLQSIVEDSTKEVASEDAFSNPMGTIVAITIVVMVFMLFMSMLMTFALF